MKTIGLTGGVASGKSTAAEALEKLGFPIVDTDGLAREILETDPSVQKKVEKQFGTLDRSRLRQAIFGDRKKREALENLLHPKIAERVDQKIHELSEQSPAPAYVVIVVPLLFESGWNKKVDLSVAVLCPQSDQLKRLIQRDGISESLAGEMIASQMPNDQKRRLADVVIENDGTIADLIRRTEAWVSTLES